MSEDEFSSDSSRRDALLRPQSEVKKKASSSPPESQYVDLFAGDQDDVKLPSIFKDAELETEFVRDVWSLLMDVQRDLNAALDLFRQCSARNPGTRVTPLRLALLKTRLIHCGAGIGQLAAVIEQMGVKPSDDIGLHKP